MREFTKSMVSFSWSMSLFGLQQMTNLLARPDPNRPRSKATEAFDCVTRATEEQFGNVLKETFRAGDKFQREMLNMMFGPMTGRGMAPRGMTGMAADAMRRGGGCCGQGDGGGIGQESAGWGPMPSGDTSA